MKRIYFISDLHLGAGYLDDSARAQLFDSFAEQVIETQSDLYLLGDFFDFWVEHPSFVRKEYLSTLITLKKLQEAHISVTLVCGNHDFMEAPFLEEFGVKVVRDGYRLSYASKEIYLCHGDNFNTDLPHRILNGILRNRLCQQLFLLLPAEWGLSLARGTSQGSRNRGGGTTAKAPHKKHQWYLQAINQRMEKEKFDLLLMGHIHIAELKKLPAGVYGNCGTWLQAPTLLYLEGDTLTLAKLESKGIPKTIKKERL